MAIYHFHHDFVKRSNGSHIVSKAAYNSGAKIEDNKSSTLFSDYTRKNGVLYDEICLPKGSPTWANDRGELWRRLEAQEDKSTRHATAIMAHSFDIALPYELTLEQNIFLAKDLVREQFTRKGYAVDWAIHAADPRGDVRNIHLHILVPLRKIDGEGFSRIKDRYNKTTLRQSVKAWRRSWAVLANRHLRRYGHKEQIDERSNKARGIKRAPTRHKGVQAKTQRKFLEAMRKSPLPKAPIIRTKKHSAADGTIRMRKTIKNSALNKIGFQPRLPLDGKTTGAKQMPPVSPVGRFSSDHNRTNNQPAGKATTTSVPSPPLSRTSEQAIRQSSGAMDRVTKHVAKDGTISMRVVVSIAALHKQHRPEAESQQQQPSPAPRKTSRGWPAAAVRDWEAWGSKNPARFFAIWPELSSGGGGALLDGATPCPITTSNPHKRSRRPNGAQSITRIFNGK